MEKDMVRQKEDFKSEELSKRALRVRLTLSDERRLQALVSEIGQRQMAAVARTAMSALLDEWGIEDPGLPKLRRKAG